MGESAGQVVLSVELSAVSALEVTVDYASADFGATAGSDYTAASGTVTIPAGEMTGTITVAILNDPVHENDEEFTLTLINPVNATLVNVPGTKVLML